MRLKVSVDEARRLVLSIPHKTWVNAVNEHWKVVSDGTVRAQSVFWLDCWAKTGMSSENARLVSVQVFDEVLPVSFSKFDSVVDHAYAREARYRPGNIQNELSKILAPVTAEELRVSEEVKHK
jgi:hypothetical protein